jgi:1-acyl-sn-glycerol-3-phosphate acyltransferase
MKYILMPFKFLWVIWGLVVFMSAMIVLTPIFLILILLFGKKVKYPLVQFNYHILSPYLLAMTLIFRKYYNRESMPESGPCVLISNHQSMSDIIINACASKQAGFFLSKKSMTKFPIFGLMVKTLGILVDRSSEESRKKSYLYMVKTIKEDKQPIFIYPEGTRNRTDEPLKEFYDGAFRLALETQVPIIAQTLIGAKKIYHPNHPLQMQPGLVHIYFDKIDTTKYGKDEVKKLKDDVKQIMWNRIVNHPK